jgi:hypothetical protein
MTTNTNALPLAKKIAHAIGIELTQHPEHWTQGALVTFEDGRSWKTGCDAQAPDAVCWCLEGFIFKYLPPPTDILSEQARIVFDVFKDVVYNETKRDCSLSYWNDKIATGAQNVIDICALVAILPEGT